MAQRPEIAFAPERADRAQAFFERVLRHTKGRWARSPFVLTDWQRDEIIRPIFGTVRRDPQLTQHLGRTTLEADPLADWVRLYNEVWLELGRKNGKSELMAGIALYLLCADGEESAEIYGAAKDRDQASLVFNVAAKMVKLSPVLNARLNVIDSRRRIVDPVTDSVYQIIAADADGNLGQDPHGILFDEIISQPNRDLYDALRTGFGGRSQPLLVCATTAGNDPEGFAAGEHAEAIEIAKDPRRQPNRFVYIRNTPADADPWLEKNWYHANPALGDFLNLEILRSEAEAAKHDPRKENSFRQFRLNQWVQQSTRWIQLHKWDRSAGMVLEEDLVGRHTFGGLDLAANSDLAAWLLLFPPADYTVPAAGDTGDEDEELEAGAEAEPFDVLARFWLPEKTDALDRIDKATGGNLNVWIREGRITLTAGEVIDYDEIHDQIAGDAATYDLNDISLDIWNSTATSNWAERNGITAVARPQTFAALSPPSKELERLIKLGLIRHGGNPVLRWMADSVEVTRDRNDNIRPVKPNKAKTGKRIDGIVALILALDGAMRRGTRRRSAYEERGVDVV